jgi:hypothetical protein
MYGSHTSWVFEDEGEGYAALEIANYGGDTKNILQRSFWSHLFSSM